MSWRKSVTLWCDAEECGNDEPLNSQDLGDETVRQVRAVAKSNGHHLVSGSQRDICDECWAEGRR